MMKEFAPAKLKRKLVSEFELRKSIEQFWNRYKTVRDVRRQPCDLTAQMITGLTVGGDVDRRNRAPRYRRDRRANLPGR